MSSASLRCHVTYMVSTYKQVLAYTSLLPQAIQRTAPTTAWPATAALRVMCVNMSFLCIIMLQELLRRDKAS